MNKTIRIATLIPVYNDEKYLEESIESIFNQKINSNITNDIFVCLNNSKDKSNDIVYNIYQKYNLFFERKNGCSLKKLEQNKFQGTTPTRNRMIHELAVHETNWQYDYIANQDGDDVWIDSLKLQKQIDYLEENKDVDILGTQYIGRIKNQNTDPKDYILLDRRPLDHDNCINWLFNGHNPIGNASAVFRRDLFTKIGGYEDLLPLTEDMWFWYKAALSGAGFANLEDDCLLYNVSNNPNYSPSYPLALKDIFCKILDARRKI